MPEGQTRLTPESVLTKTNPPKEVYEQVTSIVSTKANKSKLSRLFQSKCFQVAWARCTFSKDSWAR